MNVNNSFRVGVCIPTIRVEQISTFLDKWIPIWKLSRHKVSVYIHADKADKIFDEKKYSDKIFIKHTCHKDIDLQLKNNEWIIPRCSGACRSFPMLLAYKDGCDFIITIDDDCLPSETLSDNFIDSHINAFNKGRWYSTIDGEFPRGIPYIEHGELNVCLNHGLWENIPDFDGPTSLVNMRNKKEIFLKDRTDVVPPGMYFPLCAMNVCYSRHIFPAAYNLLMGFEKYGIDRFDDIWSGIFIKKIADSLGLYVTNGRPFVNHTKASNYFVNTKKEIEGIRLNEELWKYIDKISLKNKDVKKNYLELADAIMVYKPSFTSSLSSDYFQLLGKAMVTWIECLS